MPPFNNPATGPISLGDVPEAVTQLDRRTTAIEDYLVKQGAPSTIPATTPTGVDPRIDDIYAVLEKFFGKELAEAATVRLGPQNPGVAVQPGPVVTPPAQTMQRPGLVDTTPAAPLDTSAGTPSGFVPSPQPAVTVPPDNQFRPG